MGKVGVVWISRHELNDKNKEILTKAFGDWELVEWIKQTVTTDDLENIVIVAKDKAKHMGLDRVVFVAVLPPQLLMELLKIGVELFRFIIERKVDEKGDVEFIPIGLEKIVKIEVVTERVV